MSDINKLSQAQDYFYKGIALIDEYIQASSGFQPASQPVADFAKPAPPLAPFPQFATGTYLPTLTGRIERDVVIREVNTKRGPTTVADVHLTDGSKTVKISLWGDLANALQPYNVGEVVTLTGLSVRTPYNNVDQLSSTSKTTVS